MLLNSTSFSQCSKSKWRCRRPIPSLAWRGILLNHGFEKTVDKFSAAVGDKALTGSVKVGKCVEHVYAVWL